MHSEILQRNFEQLINEFEEIPTDHLLFVIDSEIHKLYGDWTKLIQKIESKKISFYVTNSGESAKTMSEYEKMTEFFIQKGAHRKSTLIAIGGGATTDVAGFVASTLLRGIRWVAVPTTLLGMVDAAIGGKTAINSTQGKNLVGSFHTPEKVILCSKFLETLPPEQIQCGTGEIIKYGLINEDIFHFILNEENKLPSIIQHCAHYKNELVGMDFKEAGLRQVLNFGHTIGHAIEKIYQISHGESVFWGMYVISKIFGENEVLRKLTALAHQLDSGFQTPPWYQKTFPLGEIMNFIQRDKKRVSSSSINLIIVDESHRANIKEYPLSELEQLLENNINEIKTISL